MTISTETRKYRYQGNGVTDTFAFDNRVFATSDLIVQLLTRATDAVVSTLTLTTDYTVTLLTNGNASVEITNASKIPSASQDILITADTPLTQNTSLPTGSVFPAKAVESGLDKSTIQIQELREQFDRTIRLPASSSSVADLELPTPVANQIIGWNSDADGLENKSVSLLGAVTVGTSGAVVGLLNANKTDSGNNSFTGLNIFESATPRIIMFETDLAADTGRTVIVGDSGKFVIGTATDNSSAVVEQIMVVERTAAVIDAVRFPNGINPNPSGGSSLNRFGDGLSWTPSIEGGTVTGAATYSTQVGRYFEVGDWVYVDFSIALTSFTGTGQIRIAGLPVAPASSTAPNAAIAITGLTFGSVQPVFAATSGTNTFLILSHYTATGVSSSLIETEITPASSVFRGGLWYRR